jgi:hypothetical protein
MPRSPKHLPTSGSLVFLAFSCLLLGVSPSVRAAAIQPGNVTTGLGPTFFVDDASNGGSDTDINQPSNTAFDRNFNGLLTRDQGPTRIILTGFGFATHTSPTANDATSVAVSFIYLGADELPNTADDVAIGTATGSFAFVDPASNPNAEYVFVFDSPLTADLDITGTRFRIRIAPSNNSGNGSLKLKTGALAHETVTDTKLSVAGFTTPRIDPRRVNLAKFQPVTVSSTSGQRAATYVTDGVTGNDNRWQSQNWAWNNARVDFPFPVEVGSAQVFTGVDDTLPVTNFSIQYLAGETWVTIPGGSVSGNTSAEHNLVFTGPVTATSFRLLGQDAPLHVREFALYPPNGPAGFPLGSDLTLNLAYQRPVVASAATAGNFALKAVDGRAHPGSKWQTAAAGINTLEIDLRVSTKIGSAHLYSGTSDLAPLPGFTLQSWDGTAWQNIPGATVAGNTAADLVVPFTTPVTTSKVRLEFTNPGTTAIRELCLFPANTGNTGYPLGTNIIPSGSVASYETYNDSFYLVTHPASGRHIAVPTDDQPALDEPGLSTGQGHYQILLNHSTGTYRLRNRASGHCLSGAQLSKTPGLPLTDAPYSALPHQDWILDPLGGGDFQLVNQWSGLVIDTEGALTGAGTSLVQNTASGAPTQRWQFSKFAGYPKKGIGGTSFAMATGPDWAYNWGRSYSQPIPSDASYYPMQWGNFNWDIGSNLGPIRQEYSNWRRRSDGIHILGFNEPDRTDQSNMTLGSVISLWPRLLELDLPLVSPAPGTPSWLAGFYTQAESLGYRVDYTAIHNYPGPNGGSSNNLIDTVLDAYNDWDRPVWLTEFSFVDWGRDQSWSEEDNYNCLAEFLWRAESVPELRKYALFVFTEDANNPQPANTWQDFTPAPRSNSYDINGKLTAFGKLYTAWDNDATVRTNKPYHLHHKNSRKRIANLTTQSNLAGRNIRTDGDLVKWTLVSAGANNRYHIVSELDGRRLGTDGSVVSLSPAGTTGSTVEWSLTASQHGWYYLGHPASSKRLHLSYNNSNFVATYTMAAGTATDDAVQWRFIVPPSAPVWSGAADNSWTPPGSWTPGITPTAADVVSFNESSASNLATMLDANFSIEGITVGSPAGPVSIGGTQSLTLGSAGIDLSAATRDLTITAPAVLGAAQSWNVAAGRTLAVNGGLSGDSALSIEGLGITSFGGPLDPLISLTVASGTTLKTTASSVLASGPAALNPTLQGTLDLAGNPQSLNFITGSGIIDNTAPGPASITLGNHNAGGTLNTLLQSTGGPLTLVKTGSANLVLPLANTHSGGFTNDGSGTINPQNNAAFGSGPVVMNGTTIYATAANYTFTNPLTLNGAILRVGGANSRTLVWSGPVTAAGNSGISADGSTTGVALDGSLDIAGATFTSTANNNVNTLAGPITGAGGNLVTAGNNGTLVINGTASYGGSTLIGDNSFLRLGPTGTLPPASGIEINGGLTIRNTVGWIHNGTITGDGTGVINLNTGTNATLAGPISGIASINANNTGTDATVSGIIGGAASVNVQSQGGILRLTGPNAYSGTTTIATLGTLVVNGDQSTATGAISVNGGTLAGNGTLGGTVTVSASGNLAPGNPAPAGTADTLSIGGGLNISAPANGGSGKLRFDLGPVTASDKLSVAGTLTIGGGFLGFSDFVFTDLGGLENGTYPLITSGGISGTLSSIPANLTGPLGNGGGANGRLRITGSTLELVVTGLGGIPPYTAWSGGAAFGDDANADGIDNGIAFLLGAASPATNALGLLPAATRSGNSLVLTFDCLPTADRGDATLEVQHSDDLGLSHPWFGAPVPGEAGTTAAGGIQFVVTDPGAPGGLLKVVATIQSPAGKIFARLRATIP